MEKIKTLAEYQQLASRTCPDLGSKLKNGMHMVIGFKTELGEALDALKKPFAYGKTFDKVNLGEEFADAAWYIVNEMTFAGRTLTEEALVREGQYRNWKEIFEHIHAELKKSNSAEYSSDFDLKVHTYMEVESMLVADFNQVNANPEDCVNFLIAASEYWEIDFFQALTNNIAKLKVRYPEKFDSEKALNRDLDSERKELEK